MRVRTPVVRSPNLSEPVRDAWPRRVIGRTVDRLRQLGPRGQAALVFVGYLVASCLLWGRHLIPHLGSAYLSTDWSDVRFDAWCLGWWPRAILHGWNPLHTGLLWAPTGVNMTLLTGLPGPALVAAPLTLAAGPIVSENVLFLLAPALNGLACYLLCRRATGRFWPAVAGGSVFGFSSFVAVHMAGHLNLVLLFPVPLAAYLVLRRLDGTLGSRRFVALLAVSLLAELSISSEIFATMALVGGGAIVASVVFSGAGLRRRLLAAGRLTALAYAIVLLVSVPYALATFRGFGDRPVTGPAGGSSESSSEALAAQAHAYETYLERYSIDGLSFVVPRQTPLLGSAAAHPTAAHIAVSRSEDVGYIGLPLLVLLAAFAVTERRRRSTWLLVGVFVTCSILALGPVLQVGGTKGWALPWTWVSHVPVLREALPARLELFAWLALGVAVAMWLAAPSRSAVSGRTNAFRGLRWALAVLGVVALLPAVPPPNAANVPAFFADGTYRRYIEPNATVLAIPFYIPNASMTWQVAADYGFRLAGGYVGFRAVPVSATHEAALRAFFPDRPGRMTPATLQAFDSTQHVDDVVVAGWAMDTWRRLLSSLPVAPQLVDGVWLFQLSGTGPTTP
jgi:hypothetical protein